MKLHTGNKQLNPNNKKADPDPIAQSDANRPQYRYLAKGIPTHQKW